MAKVLAVDPAGKNSGKCRESKRNQKNQTGKKAPVVSLPKSKGKVTVKARFQVVMFIMTTTKKMALVAKHSQKHKGRIVFPPDYKNDINVNGRLKQENLFQRAVTACFGKQIPMKEVMQFQYGDIMFYVYRMTNAHTLQVKPEVFFMPIAELRNRKKVKVNNQLHRIPNSCQFVLSTIGKELMKEIA